MQRTESTGRRGTTRAQPPTFVYVPESFDPKVHLSDDLQQYADGARYFLHRIYWGRVERRLTRDEYVPLKFDYLREVIPDRVIKPLKRCLIENEVIACDGHYIEGEKSLGYRLGPRCERARIVRVRLSDGRTAARIEANRRAEVKKVRLDVHKYLRTWFTRLEIDLTLARSLLAGDPNYEINCIPPRQIAAKEWSFSVCRYGRVHTDLTRCPKLVRPALRFGGQPLVEIDVANSQPLFLALIIINYRKSGNKTFAYLTFPEERRNPYDGIEDIINNTILPFGQKKEEELLPSHFRSITTRKREKEEMESSPAPALETIERTTATGSVNRNLLREDELLYVYECERGELYHTLMERLEVRSRKAVKVQFFEYLYGTNHLQSPLKSDFTEIYPHVAEVIRAHKRKDHSFLPRLMQNIEANFVINTVCRRLMDDHPDAPVLTIHDCILTTAPHVEIVQRVMREEFNRLGLAPTFHVRSYGSSGCEPGKTRSDIGTPSSCGFGEE